MSFGFTPPMLAQFDKVTPEYLSQAAMLVVGFGSLFMAWVAWSNLRLNANRSATPQATLLSNQPIKVGVEGTVSTSNADSKWTPANCVSLHRSVEEKLRQHDVELAAVRTDFQTGIRNLQLQVEDLRSSSSSRIESLRLETK